MLQTELKCRWYLLCPMRPYEEQGVLSTEITDPWCKGDWSGCARYQAQESGQSHSNKLLPDGTIDEDLP